MNSNPGELENRIDYHFKDKKLLDKALTHSSFVREYENREKSNERLEFLGDAFLDAVIGEELFRLFACKGEGFLSQTRAIIVCESSLAEAAAGIGLCHFIKLGKGEEKSGGRRRQSILADAMEAIFGAIYLDGGFEEVKRVILGLFKDTITKVKTGEITNRDKKSALQEKLQEKGSVNIRYEIIGEKGPDHDKTFKVQVVVDGVPMSTGVGKSKKKAEQDAAGNMLEKL